LPIRARFSDFSLCRVEYDWKFQPFKSAKGKFITLKVVLELHFSTRLISASKRCANFSQFPSQMITAYFQHLKEPIINTEAIEKDQVKRLRVFSVRVISIPRRILEKRENKGPVFE